jgi:hypothetical protein
MPDTKVGDEMEETSGIYMTQLEERPEGPDDYRRLVMEAVEKVIEQARKQAEQEASRIISEANRKAKQIAEKVVANAERAQLAVLNESRAIAKDATANIGQLTDALVTMQEDIDNLLGILGEQAHALAETAKKLETTVNDARKKTHSEITARLRVVRELNQKMTRVTEDVHHDGEKEVGHIGKDEDKELGFASSERKEPIAQPAVSAPQSTTLPQSDEDRQFLGTLELVIISPNSPDLRKRFLNGLPAATGVNLQGPPESVGKKRTQTVYLPKPVPLVKILRQMGMVKSANENSKGIIEIVLEAVDQWRG